MVSGSPWQLPTVLSLCLPSGFLQKLQGSAGTLYLIFPYIIRVDKKMHLRFLSTINRSCVNSMSWQPEGQSVTWAALSRVELAKSFSFFALHYYSPHLEYIFFFTGSSEKLLREAVGAPSLEVFKVSLDAALGSLSW